MKECHAPDRCPRCRREARRRNGGLFSERGALVWRSPSGERVQLTRRVGYSGTGEMTRLAQEAQ